jgi:two-component system, OmpR family, sensor histidine kinase KdpD
MKPSRFSFSLKLLKNCLFAMLTVAAVTVPLYLIGRPTLGEGVIALCYLLPVTWSASRWGLVPGIIAALTATLCFDFLFIPPFFTFTVGSLEGWLILVFFLGVAIFVVENIQSSLTKAREAVFMYELSIALSSQRTQDAIAHTVARELQQLFQAQLVNVVYRPEKTSTSISVGKSSDVVAKGKPDRILPILNAWGLIGEIQIWHGSYTELPPEDSRLLQNFAWQAGHAFERAHLLGDEQNGKDLASNAPLN